MPDIPSIIRDVLAASRGSAPDVALDSDLHELGCDPEMLTEEMA